MAMTSNQKSKSLNVNNNPVETLRNVGGGIADGIGSSMRDLGTGFFDQMLGVNTPDRSSHKESPSSKEHSSERSFSREQKNIWSFQQEQETRTIRSLVEQLKQEIKLLKQADSSLIQEVKDIEKITLESLPSKPGIYHIRFLELLISILKTVRAKISESRTWLMAFQSKKKKRGSAFSSLSKKKGTQFSLSQELSNARSIQ